MAATGLTNAEWVCSDVAAFDTPFDVGLATHLCGDATDVRVVSMMMRAPQFFGSRSIVHIHAGVRTRMHVHVVG